MKIRQPQVIRFEYVLKVDGEVVRQTLPGQPISILTGFAPDLPKGLEDLLLGKASGEYRAVVSPEQAYGPYDPQKRVKVKAADLPEAPRVGGGFTADGPDGQPLLYGVVQIEGDEVTLDANPQWAGKELEYTFTIHKARPAEPEEVAHGHVHGEGGVSHT